MDAQVEELPEEASELFGAPPDQFVVMRDRCAKELEKQGLPGMAKRVRQLRKPTLSVWATNQAARRRPDLAEKLLQSGRTMQAAPSTAEFRAASSERQGLIKALVDEAAAALKEGGHAAGTVIDKITRTLLAVSSDTRAQQAFARGVLEKDLEPDSGFGFSVPERSDQPDEGAGRARETEQAQALADRLELQAKELQTEAKELRRTAEEARDRVQLAQMEAERAASRAEKAQARYEAKQREAVEARAAAAYLKKARR